MSTSTGTGTDMDLPIMCIKWRYKLPTYEMEVTKTVIPLEVAVLEYLCNMEDQYIERPKWGKRFLFPQDDVPEEQLQSAELLIRSVIQVNQLAIDSYDHLTGYTPTADDCYTDTIDEDSGDTIVPEPFSGHITLPAVGERWKRHFSNLYVPQDMPQDMKDAYVRVLAMS